MQSPIRTHLGAAWDEFRRLVWPLWKSESTIGIPILRGILDSEQSDRLREINCWLTTERNRIECDVGQVHGDFGPSNILSDRKRLIVLDSGRQRCAPQLIDVAAFWAGTASCARLRGMDGSSLRSLDSAFMRSYQRGGGLKAADTKLLAALECVYLTKYLSHHCRNVESLPSPLRAVSRLIARRVYRPLFTWALSLAEARPHPVGIPRDPVTIAK